MKKPRNHRLIYYHYSDIKNYIENKYKVSFRITNMYSLFDWISNKPWKIPGPFIIVKPNIIRPRAPKLVYKLASLLEKEFGTEFIVM